MSTDSRQFRVKICGNTSAADLALAAEAGADFAGLVLDVPASPRSLPTDYAVQVARDAPLPLVAVVMDAPLEAVLRAAEGIRPAAIQLHGSEPEAFVGRLQDRVGCGIWKVVHMPPAQRGALNLELVLERLRRYAEAGCHAILLDTVVGGRTWGGTGLTSDWQCARDIVSAVELPIMLAGGLNPNNVAAAVAAVRPAGVDAASGLEAAPGRKDPGAVKQFVRRARAAASGLTP